MTVDLDATVHRPDLLGPRSFGRGLRASAQPFPRLGLGGRRDLAGLVERPEVEPVDEVPQVDRDEPLQLVGSEVVKKKPALLPGPARFGKRLIHHTAAERAEDQAPDERLGEVAGQRVRDREQRIDPERVDEGEGDALAVVDDRRRRPSGSPGPDIPFGSMAEFPNTR